MGCSRTNPLVHQAQSDSYTKKRKKESKKCVVCGEDFSRLKSESRSIFAQRLTCGWQCAANKRKAEHEEQVKKTTKPCEACGEEFHRRLHGETKFKFEKRKTCSNKCARSLNRSPKSPNGKRRAHAGTAKYQEESTLPPVAPLKRDIPAAPVVQSVVWRPAVWEGQRDCRPRISA